MFNLFKDSDTKFSWSWKWILIGSLTLSLFPPLGVGSFFLALINIWKQEYKSFFQHPLTWSWGIFSIWLIITSILANNPGEAFLGLANLLPFIALFIAFRTVIIKSEQLFLLAWLIISSSIPIVILGLGQLYLGWHSPPFLPPLIGWTLRINGVPEGRMSSVFIYANLLTLYLLISLIFTMGLMVNTYQNSHKLSNKKANLLLVYLATVLLFDVIGLILTNSRNGWAIAIFACIAFAVYLSWYWLIGIVIMISTGIAWASFGNLPGQTLMRKIIPSYFWIRLSDQLYDDRPIETLRITQWRFCLNMIKERPLWGWGLRNFTPLYEAKTNLYLGHPHNIFLMFSAETGIVGVVLLSTIMGWILWQGIKTVRYFSKKNNPQNKLILFTYLTAFGAYILFNCLDVTMFDLRLNLLGWFLLACISGISDKVNYN